MQAYVYRSRRKADTYLYLREKDAFALVPEPLQAQLGLLEFVLEVSLTLDRRLARAVVADVRAALEARGFYLQLPPPPGGASIDG